LKLIDSVLISAKQFGIEPTHLLDHVTKNPKASSCTTPRQFLTQAAPAPSPDMPLVLINTDKLIVDLGDEPKEVAAKQEAQRKDHMQLAPGLWNDAEAAIAAIGDDITNQEKIERAKAALKEMSDVGLINWQNPVKNGNGIIHLVAASRCEELTMQVVEDQTVDISLTNNLGQTALHVFAESTGNNRDLIRYEEMQFEKDQKQQVEGQAHKKDVGKKLPADELTERIATKITNAGTTLAARSAQYPGLIGLKDKQGRTAIYSAAEQVAKGGAVTIMGIINFEPALLYDEKEGGESPLAKAKQGASKKGLEWLQKKEAEKARPQPDKKAAESVNAASSGKQVSGDKKEKAEIEGEAQDPSEPGTEKKASKPAAQPAAVGVTPESAGKLQQQQQQGGHRSKT
jgi:hypothetical protein